MCTAAAVAIVLLSAARVAAQADDLAAKASAGKAAMGAGRFAEAAAVYAEIVRAMPNEPGMRLNLGMALAMAGKPAEAVPHLERALKLQPDLMPAALFLGTAQMQLGRPDRAVAPLEKVVQADPANRNARQMLADALVALERWEPASRQFRELTRMAPETPAYWFGLGRSYEALAGTAVERLQRSAPESAWTLLLTAQALAAEGRHANAYRLYRDALALRPSRETREALAEIYEKTGHRDWAAAERARQAPAPDCPRHPLECDFHAGRHEAVVAAARARPSAEADYWMARAAAELARAALVRLDGLPPSPEAALVRAGVLGRQGRAVEAAGVLKGALKRWPEDMRLRHDLAQSLYLSGDFAAAQPLLEELGKDDPEAADLAYLLGDALLRQKQPAAAIPHLKRAVARDPDLLPARAALGAAYTQTGRPAEAIPQLVAAAETDEDGSLHYQLSRAYQATGQAASAAKALARSQELRAAAEAGRAEAEAEFQITPP